MANAVTEPWENFWTIVRWHFVPLHYVFRAKYSFQSWYLALSHLPPIREDGEALWGLLSSCLLERVVLKIILLRTHKSALLLKWQYHSLCSWTFALCYLTRGGGGGGGGVQICPQSPKFEKKTCFSNNFIPGTKGPRHLKWVYIKDFCKNLLVSPFLGKSLPPGVQEADLPSWLPYSTYLYLDLHLLSRWWRLHTEGSKMFKLLFQAGMNVLNQSFCRICMSSE